MGNEFSWPCTDRKIQKRKIRESKYDMSLFDDQNPKEPTQDATNLLQVENILNQQNNYFKKPATANSLSTTKSSSEKARHEFQENSEDPEINEELLPLLIISRMLQPFESFIKDLKTIYESKFVPIAISPHPFKEDSIVVLQTRDKYNDYRMSKLTKFNISRSKKVFKITPNLIEEVNAYMNLKNQEGLSYIGCFTTEQPEISITFQFVYLQQEQQNAIEKPNLEFEVLEDASTSNIEKILANRAKKNFIFRGTVNIPNYSDSGQDRSNMQLMVFEKAFASYSYHAIEISGNDLSSEILMTKVSRYINDYCELKKLDFSGIIINPEKKTMIVILAT